MSVLSLSKLQMYDYISQRPTATYPRALYIFTDSSDTATLNPNKIHKTDNITAPKYYLIVRLSYGD